MWILTCPNNLHN